MFRHRSNEKRLKYKTYKNKLTNLLRVAKRLYFENQIEINKTNIKQTWRILNNAIGQNKKKKQLTYPLVDENGESMTEKVAKFCKYYTNIGPSLADKIAPASKSFQDFINSVPSDSLSSAKELKSIAKVLRMVRAPELTTFQFLLSKKHSTLFQIRCYQLLTYLCHQEFFQIDWKYLKLFLSLNLITLA